MKSYYKAEDRLRGEAMVKLREAIMRGPVDWNKLVSTFDQFFVSPPSYSCLINWILAQYPPSAFIQELLSRYHHNMFQDTEEAVAILGSACKYSSKEICQFVATKYPYVVKIPIDSGEIPLHHARTDTITRILLNAYPEGVGIQDARLNLPLHTAIAQHRKPNHIRSLISEGRRLKVGGTNGFGGVLVKNIEGETPLDLLCREISLINVKVDITPLYQVDFRLWQDLYSMLEAVSVHTEQNSAAEGSSADDEDFVMMHTLITMNCPEEALCLAAHILPYQVAIMDRNERSPLSLAAERKIYHKQILRKLLEMFPNAVNLKDPFNRFPLHWAAASGRHFDDGLEDIFLAKPSNIFMSDINGMFPFMLAACAKDASIDAIYRLLRECPSLLQFYIPT